MTGGTKPYLIRIASGDHVSFLGIPSDDDEPEAQPPRTTDPASAWNSYSFTDARNMLRSTVRKYAGHEFKLDVGEAT
jgi:hypothetical protein